MTFLWCRPKRVLYIWAWMCSPSTARTNWVKLWCIKIRRMVVDGIGGIFVGPKTAYWHIWHWIINLLRFCHFIGLIMANISCHATVSPCQEGLRHIYQFATFDFGTYALVVGGITCFHNSKEKSHGVSWSLTKSLGDHFSELLLSHIN